MPQIGFESSRFSYSSTFEGNPRINFPTDFSQPRGGFESYSANADVAGHHALAGELFEDPQNLLALAEAIKKDAHRADIERVRA